MYQNERDPYDEYDEYDQYGDDDEYGDYAPIPLPNQRRAWRGQSGGESGSLIEQALDWGFSGSVLAILVLTVLYVFSPIDAIPDLIPIAGQADDLAAVLAGGGSIGFLTAMRFILRTRVGRWGCLIAIILSAIGAFTVFWVLMSLFGSLF